MSRATPRFFSQGITAQRGIASFPSWTSASTTSQWATAAATYSNPRRYGLSGCTILEGAAFELLRAGALGGRRVGVYYYYDAAHDYESQCEAFRLVEPSLVEGALLIVDDTDWKQIARATRDYRARQPRARLLIELAGKDRDQPWWWEGVRVLRWR